MQVEQQSDAEKKFWARPELVEKLVLALDLESTLNLARVIDQKILQQSMASKVWTTATPAALFRIGGMGNH